MFINQSSNNKLLHVEGLRGVLALIVVVHHFILLFSPDVFVGSYNLNDFINSPTSFKILFANTPMNIFMNGHLAVCVFLCISGYVLTLSYKRHNNLMILQSGAFKRYFRLAVPVLGICMLLYILFATGIIKMAAYPKHSDYLSFGRALFASDLSFLNALKMSLFDVPVSGSNTYLPVLWTIQVEFLGVICLFAFLMFTHNLQKKWVPGLLFIAVCFFISKYYAPLLFAGGLVCLYEENITLFFRNRSAKIILLLAFLLFAGVVNIDSKAKAHTMYAFTTFFPFNAYPYFHNMAAVCLLILTVTSVTVRQIFSARALTALGKLSFSVYLLHLPVLYCLGGYLMWLYQGKIQPVFLFSICLATVILISIPFYLFVDKYAIVLSNKLGKKISTEGSEK